MQHVKIFTTQYCPYCLRAKALLRERGVNDFEEIKIDEHPAERATMIELSGRRTVPQIFIGGKHVGGCDDLQALDRQGELVPLLAG
jgi:glutaredoxin 3